LFVDSGKPADAYVVSEDGPPNGGHPPSSNGCLQNEQELLLVKIRRGDQLLLDIDTRLPRDCWSRVHPGTNGENADVDLVFGPSQWAIVVSTQNVRLGMPGTYPTKPYFSQAGQVWGGSTDDCRITFTAITKYYESSYTPLVAYYKLVGSVTCDRLTGRDLSFKNDVLEQFDFATSAIHF
jgi:hypothetical protein